MTTLRNGFLALTLGALLGGCAAPVPSSSSSTHWIACKATSDCDGVANATTCSAGYCTDSSGSRVTQSVNVKKACDPLARQDAPVQLGRILGIGTDPGTGTTYMADVVTLMAYSSGGDALFTMTRVFVSEGDELVRPTSEEQPAQPQLDGNTENDMVNFNLGDGGITTLAFKIVGGETTRVLLNPTPDEGYDLVPPIKGIPLVLKDPSSVSSFRVKDVPGVAYLESVSDVDDGSLLVLEHHPYDSTMFDYRIFWGKPDDVRERRIPELRDESIGDFVFEADPVSGDRISVHFDQHGDATTGTLRGPGVNRTFTSRFYRPPFVEDHSDAIRGLSFTCL